MTINFMSVNFMPGHFNGSSFSRPSFSAPPQSKRDKELVLLQTQPYSLQHTDIELSQH